MLIRNLAHDLRYALRALRRNPAFGIVAVLTIGLGVGVNTAVFSVIHAVLLKPLPFRDPDRLVMIWETHPEMPLLQAALPDFIDWQQQSRSFEGMAAYSFQAINKANLTGRGEPLQVQATMASHNLLSLLGISPQIGRWFLPAEETAREHVVLLSDGLWRRKFGADPSLVGRSINLDGDIFVVLGVLPPEKAFPAWADVWLPLSLLEPILHTTRQYHPVEVIARLKPGVTVEAAETEMQVIARRLAAAYPATNRSIHASVMPLKGQIVGEVRSTLFVAWAAVGLILLIASGNVAHLVLVRGSSRAREVAIRAALGAGRSRLVCQLTTESLEVALLGGGVGLLLASVVMPSLRWLAAGHIPRLELVTTDYNMFLFALAISALSGVLFGLPPALQGSRPEINQVMKQGSGVTSETKASRLGFYLVAAEVGLALVVMVGAGLLVRSFARLLTVDPGFRPDHVLTMYVPLPSSKYNWDQAARFFQNELFPRIRSLPGVEEVAAVNSVPMSLERTERTRYATRFGVPGHIYEKERFPVAQIRWMSPEYFRVMNIPLKQGRSFTESDLGKPLYLVNETLARRFFPGQDPVGKSILMGVVTSELETMKIVGVVGDVRDLGLEVEVQPTLYSPSISPGMTLVIRTSLEPLSLTEVVRQAVQAADPDQPLRDVRTMETILSDSMARRRFALWLLIGFAILALLLSTVGVYGVTSYAVARRTHELGLRMALGAQPSDIVRLLFKEGLRAVVAGIALGLIASLVSTRLMASLLYGMTPTDSVAFAGASLFLAVVAFVAIFIPARRATRMDPLRALREL